jgi:hypothetical protein
MKIIFFLIIFILFSSCNSIDNSNVKTYQEKTIDYDSINKSKIPECIKTISSEKFMELNIGKMHGYQFWCFENLLYYLPESKWVEYSQSNSQIMKCYSYIALKKKWNYKKLTSIENILKSYHSKIDFYMEDVKITESISSMYKYTLIDIDLKQYSSGKEIYLELENFKKECEHEKFINSLKPPNNQK